VIRKSYDRVPQHLALSGGRAHGTKLTPVRSQLAMFVS
jgi:hypothetical protein